MTHMFTATFCDSCTVRHYRPPCRAVWWLSSISDTPVRYL